jgi:2-desacetyl-2-hydroxyethyl bacteriochlorophyllide A dehydrogenase
MTGAPGTFRALLLQGPNQLVLTELERQPLQARQVRIRVRTVGVCGSDYSSVAGRLRFTRFPIVPGHEAVGEVIESTDDTDWAVGDEVVVHPLIVSRDDPAFGRSDLQHAPSAEVLGVVSRNGAFAEEVIVEDYMLRRIPKDLAWDRAAFIEPVAVAVQAVERGRLEAGDRLLLLGAGSIGLLALQVAHASGAGEVVMTDVLDDHLAIARELGAARTINVRSDPRAAEALVGFDLVIDGVGSQESTQLAIQATRRGGRIVVFGVPAAGNTVSMLSLFAADLSIATSRLYGSDLSRAIELVATGAVNGDSLITHRVGLTEAEQLIPAVIAGQVAPIKVQIVP